MTPDLLCESAKTLPEVKKNYKIRIETQEVERLLKEGKKRSQIVALLRAQPSAIDYHLKKIHHSTKPIKAPEKPKPDYNKLIDWRVYNEGLVKRGEILLDLEVFKDWGEELNRMNKGKVGAPYEYPESFIEFILQLKTEFKIGYRQAGGISRKLAVFVPQIKRAPDYTTIQKRFEKMSVETKVYQKHEESTTVKDSTGIKTSNRGEYKTLKYDGKKKKEYIKLHIEVEIQTGELLGLEVTQATVVDSAVAEDLTGQSEQSGLVKKSYMDAGYDSKQVYGMHLEKGIVPIIKPSRLGTTENIQKRHDRLKKKKERHRLTRDEEGDLGRCKVLLEYLKDPELWKKDTGYGLRWHGEGWFSAFKRILGEEVFSRRYENIVKELRFKGNIMNLFKFVSRGYRKEKAIA